jgi:biopolymer transport protein ExbD
MKIKSIPDDAVAFQMAPMIDCVFLLIIFFMLVANVNQQERVRIDVPVAANAQRPKDPSGRGVITIKSDGKIFLGLRQMDAQQISDLVTSRVAENPNFKVFLRADRKTQHKFVREVMAACAAGGVSDIIFSTYEAD